MTHAIKILFISYKNYKACAVEVNNAFTVPLVMFTITMFCICFSVACEYTCDRPCAKVGSIYCILYQCCPAL